MTGCLQYADMNAKWLLGTFIVNLERQSFQENRPGGQALVIKRLSNFGIST
jgi:hypothetical protein